MTFRRWDGGWSIMILAIVIIRDVTHIVWYIATHWIAQWSDKDGIRLSGARLFRSFMYINVSLWKCDDDQNVQQKRIIWIQWYYSLILIAWERHCRLPFQDEGYVSNVESFSMSREDLVCLLYYQEINDSKTLHSSKSPAKWTIVIASRFCWCIVSITAYISLSTVH